MAFTIPGLAAGDVSREDLLYRFRRTRRRTLELAEPLSPEDQGVQSMPLTSPTRWHLGHTTWFFETLVLQPNVSSVIPIEERTPQLFNSYYVGAGPVIPRELRGQLSRPTTREVLEARQEVDERMVTLLATIEDIDAVGALVEIGIQHEGQHQELILTDIKHALACHPERPAYREDCAIRDRSAVQPGHEQNWWEVSGGIYHIGHGGPGFGFDSEGPRHKVFIYPFEISEQPVTCGEYAEFISDGGYQDPRWWLSLGWEFRQREEWSAPLYWEDEGDRWSVTTLGGRRMMDLHEPVCHVSYFEADAYARWAGARLPSEAEWEIAAEVVDVKGHFAEENDFHPRRAPAGGAESGGPVQLFGDVWEWTASPFVAYPGFRPWAGVVGEYNGKFMCNQFVLRGGSCVTSASTVRRTARNFFPPEARWQFSGFRLARSLHVDPVRSR
jgi:ergothioneine biosynthesis protein EgtB